MFTEQNATNICNGNPCIAIRKGCQISDFLSCPELNVAVLVSLENTNLCNTWFEKCMKVLKFIIDVSESATYN